MEPWQWGLLAVAAVCMGYSLFQGAKSRRRLAAQDALTDAKAEVHAMETSALGVVQQLEVRAYDYSREVEARIDNRLAVLDQLIIDADQEIDRLQQLLHLSAEDRDLTPAEQQRCFTLQEAGCTVDEISRCLNVWPERVQCALDQWQTPGKRAA